jgi:uncharacterized protein YjbI with pentapeptide repeats
VCGTIVGVMDSAFVSPFQCLGICRHVKQQRKCSRPSVRWVIAGVGNACDQSQSWQLRAGAIAAAAALSIALPALSVHADTPVDVRPQLKVSGGAASTTSGPKALKSVIKTVTRGVSLEGADFSNQDMEGVSFQQSILRQANFSGSKLRATSFFDADLSGANLSDADLSLSNFELANLRSVNATNTVFAGSYMSSTTKFDGIQIEGSDWSETLLRKDQQRYLCDRASGTNPTTGVDTRESLMCP